MFNILANRKFTWLIITKVNRRWQDLSSQRILSMLYKIGEKEYKNMLEAEKTASWKIV